MEMQRKVNQNVLHADKDPLCLPEASSFSAHEVTQTCNKLQILKGSDVSSDTLELLCTTVFLSAFTHILLWDVFAFQDIKNQELLL